MIYASINAKRSKTYGKFFLQMSSLSFSTHKHKKTRLISYKNGRRIRASVFFYSPYIQLSYMQVYVSCPELPYSQLPWSKAEWTQSINQSTNQSTFSLCTAILKRIFFYICYLLWRVHFLSIQRASLEIKFSSEL